VAGRTDYFPKLISTFSIGFRNLLILPAMTDQQKELFVFNHVLISGKVYIFRRTTYNRQIRNSFFRITTNN
jgi:hypothetical protein